MTLCFLARTDGCGARHRRPALVALALACLGIALASGPAAAVGLGVITQQSALGQSLRIVVPVTLGEGEDPASECFRIVAADRDTDGVAQVLFGRVSVERSAGGTALVVTSARPVNDPVVRVTLQAGCEAKIRREYTLFMDPPAIEAPVVAAEPAPREAVAAPPPAPAAREARRPARPPSRATTRQAPSTGAGEGAEAARKSAPAKGRTAAKSAPRRPPPAPTADRPRLAVSSGAPGAATEADRERTRQEQAARIEAETQVLRQRIVELTALVERMQEELRTQERAEQEAAEAARNAPPPSATGAAPPPPAATQAAAAPAEPAKAPPAAKAAPIPDGDWWDDNGTLIGIVLVLPFLLAAFLLWRRRRAAEDEQWRAARIPTSRGESTTPGPTSMLRNPVAGLVSPRTEAASTITGMAPAEHLPADDAVDALAVSELSHATEEARVFVALGHPERAIEVLREHLRQLPRSMPAAWLMLLDLYHTEGNRPEFRKLAEDFHVHFNVQTPLWEAFATEDHAPAGIESFPHVQKQVVELWRKPGCRAYLERLLYDNREGRRNGFPLSTYSDILLLLQVLDAPEDVDIDTDLRESGRLDASTKPAAATTPSRGRRPMPPDPAASRPIQQPIRFELDPPSSQGKPKS